MSGFLLVIVAGTIAGDAVAGDAATGYLRYLLIRPVKRARMLVGDPTAREVVFHTGSDGLYLPSDMDGYTPPPAGSPNYCH